MNNLQAKSIENQQTKFAKAKKKLTEEEIIYGINLCDDWIYSHVLCYWNSDDDKDSHRWAEELVYTTTLKLDLLKLINND